MRVHEAAHQLLTRAGVPLSSRELAKRMLEQELVSSNAKDPVFSLATTIEKTIRDGAYNKPKLEFVFTSKGERLISNPGLKSPNLSQKPSAPKSLEQPQISVRLSSARASAVTLAMQAGIGASMEECVDELLRRGLRSASGEIRSSLMKKLDTL